MDHTGDCPECGESWKGNEIPPSMQYAYGHKEYYSLLIGVEYAHGSPERYDGVSEWMCPHCSTRWGRWTNKKLARDEIEPRFGEQT